MSFVVQLILSLHACALRLYPREFRAEFAEEMQAVFTKAMTGAIERGGRSLAALLGLRWPQRFQAV